VDQEKEELKQRVNVLEKEVETAKQSEVVRNMLSLYEERLKAKPDRKKNGS
jgi:cell division septum initiation protein DivIVA